MMDLDELRSLVRKCTDPRGPSLYRKLYGLDEGAPALDIKTWDDWISLPYITKDLLLATPFTERCFCPRSDIDHIRASSGTSGKPPLFSPRTAAKGIEYRLGYHDFRRPILAYTTPTAPHLHEEIQRAAGHPPRVITFDPAHPEASIRLARIAGVDSISVFAFHVPLIGEHMEREGMTQQIRLIEMCGETCSRSLFDYIRKTFPNATILPQFGSGEAENQPVGIPCRAVTGEEPMAIYHVKESQFHEIADIETGSILKRGPRTEGELILTSYGGEPAALPLIRYKTGDMVRLMEDTCGAHRDIPFTVLGRVEMDFMKIPGGLLRADEVERVLRTLKDSVSDHFELHRTEHDVAGTLKIGVTLHVTPCGQPKVRSMAELAKIIAAELRVGPSRTYEDGVRSGMYVPLECKPISTASSLGKRKRMRAM